MSESYKSQVSYRFGQNQQSMLNLRGETVQELHYLVAEAADGEFVSSLTHLDATLQAGTALTPVTSPAPQGNVYQQAPQQAPQAQPPQPPAQQGYQQTAAPSCPHGTRQYKTGVGAKGPWAAYFCPLPKGSPGACGPEWSKA